MPRRLWRWAHGEVHRRTVHLPSEVQAMLWAAASGVIFCVMNALVRQLLLHMHPQQGQFLRYFFGLVVILPWVLRHGWTTYRPQSYAGHFLRGGLHALGLWMWFASMREIPLADTTAIGFTTPLFVMLGAWLIFKEPMRWERWLAAGIGFVGVLIVVGPKLSWQGGPGLYHLVMLASSPVFATTHLLTKTLTRQDRPVTIVLWQSVTITLLSLPLALPVWRAPSAWEWLAFLAVGVLGSLGHYCSTHALHVADVTATQSVKFLDLVWAAFLGWIIFSDVPTSSTLLGGAIIFAGVFLTTRRR